MSYINSAKDFTITKEMARALQFCEAINHAKPRFTDNEATSDCQVMVLNGRTVSVVSGASQPQLSGNPHHSTFVGKAFGHGAKSVTLKNFERGVDLKPSSYIVDFGKGNNL